MDICVQVGRPITQQDHPHWAKAGGEEKVVSDFQKMAPHNFFQGDGT